MNKRIKIILKCSLICSILLIFLSTESLKAQDFIPNLEIKGTNFKISKMVDGVQAFQNRTAMHFSPIPIGFSGWCFTYINANANYMPGPLPSFSVKLLQDGYMYGLVEDKASESIVQAWAQANGWVRDGNVAFVYGTGVNQTAYLYKKQLTAGTWFNIVQPNVFSGLTLIAPFIFEEGKVLEPLDNTKVDITANGYVSKGILLDGATIFGNRTYVFQNVPLVLQGKEFIRLQGGVESPIKLTSNKNSKVYLLTAKDPLTIDLTGWSLVPNIEPNYNDNLSTKLALYFYNYTAGTELNIPQGGNFVGGIVVADTINLSTICDFPPLPGVPLMNSPKSTGIYLGSPSISILPNGDYIASFQSFGGIGKTFIYKSYDKGITWSKIIELSFGGWANIFVLKDELYLMGTVSGYSDFIISKSMDWGLNWTTPTSSTTGIIKKSDAQKAYHTAATPVVIKDGRIYRALEQIVVGVGWGENFHPMMISAPVNSDLLNANNWTSTNTLTKNSAWLQSEGYSFDGWLEGNAVIDPDGNILDILRVHEVIKGDKAAIARLSADNTTMTFSPTSDIINMPGACKKFVIRYDSISRLYFTLTNVILEQDRNKGTSAERTRNTQAILYSTNLKDWTQLKIVLHHDDVLYHGFQYLDWQFEGNDIIAISRTAWDDCTGGADSQHNSNYISFHRFKNFREGINVSSNVTENNQKKTTVVSNISENRLDIQLSNATNTNYSIYNVSGKNLKKGNVSNNESINITGFSKGIYFIHLNTEGTFKFICY